MGFLKSIVATAAPIVGAAVGGPVGAQIGSAIGGYISNREMQKQAGETAQQYAARMQQLGQQGYFRPVATKTYFGHSNFEVDPVTGAVKSAGYTPSQSVAEQQGKLGVLMGQGLTAAEQAVPFAQQYAAPAQGLFNLGQSYLAPTAEEARQRYVQQQMDILRPYDIEEEQRLAASNLARGTGGLSVGTGGNPLLRQLLEQRNIRNAQIAAQADPYAQQQITFGQQQLSNAAGLLGTGYDLMQGALAPYQSYLSNQAKLDELARLSLQQGLDIGSAAIGGQQYAANLGKDAAGVTARQQLAQAEAKNEALQGLFGNQDLINKAGGWLKTGATKLGGLFGGSSPSMPSNVLIPGGGIGGGINSAMSAYGMGSGSYPQVSFAGSPVNYIN